MAVAVGDKATADFANTRPATAAGTIAASAPSALNNNSSSGSVTLPSGRFSIAPVVQLTQQASTGSDTRTLHVTSVSATGFSWANVQNSGTLRAININWTATEPT